jgi:putative membrane protein
MFQYLMPWEFSPTVFIATALSAVFYARGLIALRRTGSAVGIGPPLAFFTGLALIYGALQTYVDYLSQHMFWVHRLQHLILHHTGPFLLILGAPLRILGSGLPLAMRARGRSLFSRSGWLLRSVNWIQGPLMAPLLFTGLIYWWLIPAVHFTAMLDADRYRMMNWSMAIDGILFWWLMLTPRGAQGRTAVGYPVRILLLVIVTLLQIFLGAHIALHKTVLYDVYGICGRAWAISPLVDQQLGGLLTWIPPAMMFGLAILLNLRMLLHDPQPPACAEGAGPIAASAVKS